MRFFAPNIGIQSHAPEATPAGPVLGAFEELLSDSIASSLSVNNQTSDLYPWLGAERAVFVNMDPSQDAPRRIGDKDRVLRTQSLPTVSEVGSCRRVAKLVGETGARLEVFGHHGPDPGLRH